jgi:DNA-binding MarR family transcriptional regulator
LSDRQAIHKPWFETAEPPHRRLLPPRLFKILSLVRRFSMPQARRLLGLSDFEWRVMSQVGDRAPMSLNELAAVSAHDKGQLSRGVKRLVEAGLLVRESRKGERGVFISPTKAGQRVFDQLVELAYKQNDELIEGLTPEQLRTFSEVLDKIETNAKAVLSKEPECAVEAEAPAPARRTAS